MKALWRWTLLIGSIAMSTVSIARSTARRVTIVSCGTHLRPSKHRYALPMSPEDGVIMETQLEGEGHSTDEDETYDNPQKPHRHGFSVGKREHQWAQVQHRRTSGGRILDTDAPDATERAAQMLPWAPVPDQTRSHTSPSLLAHRLKRSATYEENFPPNYQRRKSLDGMMLSEAGSVSPLVQNDYEYDDTIVLETEQTGTGTPALHATTSARPPEASVRATAVQALRSSDRGDHARAMVHRAHDAPTRAPTVPTRTHVYENCKEGDTVAVREESNLMMHVGDGGAIQDRRTTKFESVNDMC
eukprot:m.12008 g.12008  ORF g.12008 m.12008 type:complete len:301 (-) comp9349_c0_seq1:3359-4261(-)